MVSTMGSMNNRTEKLMKQFEGMASQESCDHQVDCWVEGIPLHNPVRDECCPDFSCCEGEMLPLETRQKLQAARNKGDVETVQAICMGGLGSMLADNGVDAHIIGEDE